ncbi:hypothetical protein AD945_08410 [Gluconobacter albidus]|uniref:Uncharacterized protein n=1 Tax=Gluconobacter albidus TaxID=318683 RepID=A0A149TJA9_9PROT|nr:hypothetical protein [Gluconobacter albidus]KXV48217.1 hypothetical protein AD945_08410 [Gluconobacter albidus]
MSDALEAAPVNEAPSTTLQQEQSTALGADDGGADNWEKVEPAEIKPEPKPQTRREAIEAAADKLEKDDKAPDKPAPEQAEAKPREDATVPADKVQPDEKADPELPDADKPAKAEQEPEKKTYKAPARFLPKAQDTWANTPNAVKAEVSRMERDFEAMAREGMEDRQYRQTLKEFEDYAGKSGTKLSDALKVYTELDRHLAENPVQGVAELLKRIGMTPQQYAEIVQQNSPQYQALMMQRRAQAVPAQPQEAPEVQQLRTQLHEEQSKRVYAEVIQPFRAAHPRFDELQETIARCLNSGMIPAGLSHNERLEAAYDMAERLSPRSTSPQVNLGAPAQDPGAQTANPRAGKNLSVKGAPSSGSSASPVRRGKLSRREAIVAAMDGASRR